MERTRLSSEASIPSLPFGWGRPLPFRSGSHPGAPSRTRFRCAPPHPTVSGTRRPLRPPPGLTLWALLWNALGLPTALRAERAVPFTGFRVLFGVWLSRPTGPGTVMPLPLAWLGADGSAAPWARCPGAPVVPGPPSWALVFGPPSRCGASFAYPLVFLPGRPWWVRVVFRGWVLAGPPCFSFSRIPPRVFLCGWSRPGPCPGFLAGPAPGLGPARSGCTACASTAGDHWRAFSHSVISFLCACCRWLLR